MDRLVAGYEVGGIQSYYASDEERNRIKGLLEALMRSLPERSMRMQVRFEIAEGTGDLVSRYIRERRSESPYSANSISTTSSSGKAARPRVSTCDTSCTCTSSGIRGFTTSRPTSSGNER